MSFTIRKPQEITASYEIAGKQLTFKTGILAPSCDGAVRVKLGQTEVLVTTVMKKEPNPDKDFLPLTIDFRDSNHAVGKIGGGPYRRREGRPTEMMTLYSRIVDRTLRPMFPKGMVNDIVISITPLSFDREDDLAILGIIWGSLATIIAWIPFDGPVSGVRVGYSADKSTLLVNPTISEFEDNGLNLLVSGKAGSINMIEMDGTEISEDSIEKAFVLGQEMIDKLCQVQQDFLSKCEKKDLTSFATYNYPPEELKAQVAQIITHQELEKLYESSKTEWEAAFSGWRNQLRDFLKTKLADESITDKGIYTREKAYMSMELLVREYFKELILDKNVRVDGRKLDEIRQLYAETGLLEQVHGSALFWRGDTQILNICTLGAPGDVQLVDDMVNDATEKRYMHHYNFPPFSVNEAMKIRGTGNREIGHGKLAEKAVEFVIPPKAEFPYTIRLVSDCLSSGGSTSMGSVCASTLALMDAWVPIRKPVSGIAMGLASRVDDNGLPKQYQVLTDIQGAEDHHCDMDFKVAGTPDGITAIQLDMKVRGISVAIAMEVVKRANVGRLEIMQYMLTILDKPRAQLAATAPKITVIHVDPDKIKVVIGKGWEQIDKIIAETGVKIDFDDDGTCCITSKDAAAIARTIEIIEGLVYAPKIGDTFDGVITRIENYGIFVNFHGKMVGLAGTRNLGLKFGENPAATYKLDQRLKVKIVNITAEGKVDLAPA